MQSPSQPASPKPTVLIVDDEPQIRNIMSDTVESLDCDSIQAADISQARQALEQPIDLAAILCDQRLPDGSGLDFCRELKKTSPDMIRILITGFPDMKVAVAAINDGEIFRFVSKPFEVSELRGIIREAIDKNRLVKENQRLHSALVGANDQLQKANASLQKALSSSFALCVDIIDRFDHVLASHSSRVAKWAVAIGKQFALSQDQLATLEIAGQMHDIGLISSSRSTHGNQQIGWEELSPLPQTAMHNHPKTGAELTRFLQYNDVPEILIAHHEWFNGGGYPYGLAGERVPLLSYMIAVPDAYDEVPMSRSDAAKFIEENLGIRFHPEAGRAFLRILNENPEMTKQEREVLLTELQNGMKLSCNLYSPTGMMLVPKGQSLTPKLIQYIHQHNLSDPITQRIFIES
ncbi:MAG: response regulator [Verrucomicrobiae bacterium]|nr:response regulator [Verrucomicrobiae bacterium]